MFTIFERGISTVAFYDAITEFIFIEDRPQKSDIIFIPGSDYGCLAAHAAALYREGLAPYVMPSGKYSILSNGFCLPQDSSKYLENKENLDSIQTECDYLSAVLMQNGVPASAVLPEPEASSTYENAIFSRRLLDKLGITIHTAILSCQAYHARRCLLYYQLLFPEVRFCVSPVITQGISRDNWFLDPDKIDKVLGEMERCGSQFHNILKEMLPSEGTGTGGRES